MESKKTPKSKQTSAQNGKKEEIEYSLKYKYTPFKEIIEQGEYNFYGVIYDASFPVEETNNAILPGQKEPLSKYSCVLKLIDQTTNCLTNPEDFNEQIITLIIKSNEKESMPFAHKIGDIIRVHRGLFAPKKKRNVYLNILKGNQFKGSWCIFRDSNEQPIQCSHQTYTIETQDRQIIDSTKSWIKNYFAIEKSLFYGQQQKLIDRVQQGSDYDLLVHIVKKVQLDDQLVLFIQDETDGCELHTFKYFNFLNENDIIRIRSYKVFDNDVLLLNEYGNIMVIPTESKLYKNFANKLANKLKEVQK